MFTGLRVWNGRTGAMKRAQVLSVFNDLSIKFQVKLENCNTEKLGPQCCVPFWMFANDAQDQGSYRSDVRLRSHCIAIQCLQVLSDLEAGSLLILIGSRSSFSDGGTEVSESTSRYQGRCLGSLPMVFEDIRATDGSGPLGVVFDDLET